MSKAHASWIIFALGASATASFATPVSGGSAADPSIAPLGTTPSEPAQDRSDSYRLQTLAVTAAAVVVYGAGFFIHDDYYEGSSHVSGPVPQSHTRENVFRIGIAAFLLGPPLLHVAHHRYGTALGSLALRVGLPLGSTLVGAFALRHDDDESDAGAAVGLIAGIVAASAIDIAGLSVVERAPSVLPSIVVSHGTVTIGLARAF